MSEDMPMEIWAYEDYSGFVNGHWYKKWYSNTTKYHHDSVLQAKDREIAELIRADDAAVNRNNELHDIITGLSGTIESQKQTQDALIKKAKSLEAENLRLREENERLKTAIAEAKIVQYAVEG